VTRVQVFRKGNLDSRKATTLTASLAVTSIEPESPTNVGSGPDKLVVGSDCDYENYYGAICPPVTIVLSGRRRDLRFGRDGMMIDTGGTLLVAVPLSLFRPVCGMPSGTGDQPSDRKAVGIGGGNKSAGNSQWNP
jgi:hypothetical protein